MSAALAAIPLSLHLDAVQFHAERLKPWNRCRFVQHCLGQMHPYVVSLLVDAGEHDAAHIVAAIPGFGTATDCLAARAEIDTARRLLRGELKHMLKEMSKCATDGGGRGPVSWLDAKWGARISLDWIERSAGPAAAAEAAHDQRQWLIKARRGAVPS